MTKTAEDIKLLNCINDKIAMFDVATPYVWKLRLSLNDYETLHNAIASSVASHSGSISHLLTKEFAVHTIVYLAEWYKRCYQSGSTDNKAVDPNSAQLNTLWSASGINTEKYVYLSSSGNKLWQYSLYVLGGLALKHELGKTDERFLKALCRMLHGENYTLENLDDESRAIAFRSSIKEKHSLYDFLTEIVNGHIPFHKEDVDNPDSDVRALVERIKHANEEVLKQKYRFEWIVNYAPDCDYLQRRLRLWFNPEEIGVGLHHYLRYDRTRVWKFMNPERIQRLFISLRFLDDDKVVKDVDFEHPIVSYVNTGEANTGFVAMGINDYATCHHIPSAHFTMIEIWAKDNEGNTRCIQQQECTEFLQMWRVSPYDDEWTNRQSSQKTTAVLFSNACHLNLNEASGNLSMLPFRDRKFGESVDFGWYNIFDNVTIVDEKGEETTLYNRVGYDQICTRLYQHIIAYKENGTIEHFAESDDEDFEAVEEKIPLIFRKEDIIVRHFATKNDIRNAMPESDTAAESIKFKQDDNFVEWDEASSPQYGVVNLMIYVKGRKLPYRVFYMPAFSKDTPIMRDFKNTQIKYHYLNGESITEGIVQDEITTGAKPLNPIIPIIIGGEGDYVRINVYRPTLIREVCFNGKVVEIINSKDVVIPYRLKEHIAVNCFTENGYQSYRCNGLSSIFPLVGEMRDSQLEAWAKGLLFDAIQLDVYAPDCLKVSFGSNHYNNEHVSFYKWNYWKSQNPELCEYSEETEPNTIIFQSLTKNSITYVLPTRGKFIAMKYKKAEVSLVNCFDVALAHNLYFFILYPFSRIDNHKVELYEPLLESRGGKLSEDDKKGLIRFAEEFNFDWKEKYKIEF